MVAGRWLALAFVVIGCGDGNKAAIDAPMIDGPPARCTAPATDAQAAATHVVYVVTEGIDLVKSTGGADDSRTNVTSLISASVTVPPFRASDPNRTTFIPQILADVERMFAAYSVDFVTTRPASGDYEMMVMGGDPTVIVGSSAAGVLSVAPGVCDATNRDRIALEFDGSGGGHQNYANTLASDLGALLGLDVTSTSGDCMCRTNGCGPPPGPGICTFSAAAAVTAGHCGGGPTQDEPALLQAALGCR